jgi:hypothetical protein
LRGQIVRDIRRNIRPAASAPNQSWACRHAWYLIQQLWSLDSRHRPSAFGVVTLLNRAASSLPPIVIERIILFSATFGGFSFSDLGWKRRTRSLLTLSLVSRSFCARVAPFLYRDIRILSSNMESILSSLMNTLNISIKCRHSSDALSSGYGFYTRTFFLCIGKNADTLPTNIQGLLDKMTNLHTLVIQSVDSPLQIIADHASSSVEFRGVKQSLILDEGTLRVILPFQELVITNADLPTPGISQTRQALLLLNLQDIHIHDGNGNELLQLFHAFKDWIMPRLNKFSCNLSPTVSPRSPFIGFLQIHGPLLRDLTLSRHRLAPMSDILPLCSNLRSLVMLADSYVNLLSFPRHLKLETLHIQVLESNPERESYLDQFDTFTSSWRARLPNLRVVKFNGFEELFRYLDRSKWFRMLFGTEDSFYTVTVGDIPFKRWKKEWIGTGAPDISAENSTDATTCARCELSSTFGSSNTPLFG